MIRQIDDRPFDFSYVSKKHFFDKPQRMITLKRATSQFKAWIGSPIISDAKDARGAYSLACFRDGIRRNESVIRVCGLGGDIDRGDATLADVLDALWDLGAFGHTTFSHSAREPRSRFIVPYSRVVSGEEHRLIWEHVRARLQHVDITLDAQTKDPARLFFGSVIRPGAPFEFLENDGPPLDVDSVIVAQRELIEQNKPAPIRARAREFRTIGDAYARAVAYIAKMPIAISGAGGHSATFKVARVLVGFVNAGLAESAAISILREFSQRCDPPWSERELLHKWKQANERATRVPDFTTRRAG